MDIPEPLSSIDSEIARLLEARAFLARENSHALPGSKTGNKTHHEHRGLRPDCGRAEGTLGKQKRAAKN